MAGPFRRLAGILRSIAMYYGIPGRAQKLRRHYASFIRPGDLCFDIGAHAGNRTRAWLEIGARVVAVEPQPDFARLLRRWYGGHPGFTLAEVALGAQPGRQTLLISSRTPTVTTLSRKWAEEARRDSSFAGVQWDIEVVVEVTTLDQLIQSYGLPTFCKIDVEGYEAEVLHGLSHPVPALSFEYLPVAISRTVDCIERLNTLSRYEFSRSTGETLRPGPWISASAMTDELLTLPAGARSGDIYARIIPEGSPSTENAV